jgi:trans-AT polyketide synthase, acyltransferase and oxidoreductase domains
MSSGLQCWSNPSGIWNGSKSAIAFDPPTIKQTLMQFDRTVCVVRCKGEIGVTLEPSGTGTTHAEVLATLTPSPIHQLGDHNFRLFHGLGYAYSSGAMAGGIASADLVIALGKIGMLGSFGAGGLPPAAVEAAIQKIQAALPNGPYAFNLIHNPQEPAMERGTVELFLKYGVRTIEASAFLDLSENLVQYRVAGLSLNESQQLVIGNHIIAKLSRRELAEKFLRPAPAAILESLVQQGRITPQQATLAAYVPMADDITVEADSGGHTDNRPLVALFPSIQALRDEIQAECNFAYPVRIGAAGGISTPESVLAAFSMGAAYVVTGSVNQACLEAGTSTYAKELLAQAEMHDVAMAPAADMFEMGVKLQVLKTKSMFAVRAQKLYDIYRDYPSIEAIPQAERDRIEKQIFRSSLDEVWANTVKFFEQRDPQQIAIANANPKHKMALIFRWYLGNSSRWAKTGEAGRELDYQIWCGPAMGSFNNWVKGTYLAEASNRSVVDVAFHLLMGAAYLYRIQMLRVQGIQVPATIARYEPAPLVFAAPATQAEAVLV